MLYVRLLYLGVLPLLKSLLLVRFLLCRYEVPRDLLGLPGSTEVHRYGLLLAFLALLVLLHTRRLLLVESELLA